MKPLSLYAVLWMISTLAVSWAENPRISPPKEPILRRLSSSASWTITFKYQDNKKPAKRVTSKVTASPQLSPNLRADRLESVTVTKTRKVWWEQSVWESGNKTETWIYHDIRIGTLSDTHEIVSMPFSSEDLDSFDYRRSDFEGLEWVSLKNYEGVEDYEGTPAYVFELDPVDASAVTGATPPELAADDPTKRKSAKARIGKWNRNRIAIVSSEKQLPLYSYDGVVERTYSYNQPPTALLVPPENFMKVFNQVEIDFKELHRGPGSP